jgi:hypothetical protein
VTRRGPLLALLALAPWGGPLAAQRRVVPEWGLHGTFIVADSGRAALLGGVGLGVRTLGATRLALSLDAGTMEHGLTGRGEVAVEYLLAPRAAHRIGVYAGGGLAGVVGQGRGQFFLGYVGIEESPGLPSGWALEVGMGGGFRLRAAWHWRRFPATWRAEK